MSGEVCEGILGTENYRSQQNQMMQEVNDFGQWPPPPSHLGPHLGPNFNFLFT